MNTNQKQRNVQILTEIRNSEIAHKERKKKHSLLCRKYSYTHTTHSTMLMPFFKESMERKMNIFNKPFQSTSLHVENVIGFQGGLKAVIWVDAFQGIIMLAGILTILIKVRLKIRLVILINVILKKKSGYTN